jgi:hypothetical protein
MTGYEDATALTERNALIPDLGNWARSRRRWPAGCRTPPRQHVGLDMPQNRHLLPLTAVHWPSAAFQLACLEFLAEIWIA